LKDVVYRSLWILVALERIMAQNFQCKKSRSLLHYFETKMKKRICKNGNENFVTNYGKVVK